MRSSILTLLSIFALVSIAHADESTPTSEAGPASPVAAATAWAGVWRLDRDASDSIEEMLVVMKAPWLARKAAAFATPTLTISPREHGGLQIVNENPVRSTTEEIFVDGVPREGRDPLDRKVIRSATWNDAGQLVARNQNYVEPDEVVRITSTWSLRGDTIEVASSVQRGDAPLLIRRIFRKQ